MISLGLVYVIVVATLIGLRVIPIDWAIPLALLWVLTLGVADLLDALYCRWTRRK